MTNKVNVEIVFATAETQELLTLMLSPGATVAAAVSASGLMRRFPDVDFDRLQAGIWGHPVARDRVLADGDRVEIYRPLELDPKEARRQLALMGRTMSGGSTD